MKLPKLPKLPQLSFKKKLPGVKVHSFIVSRSKLFVSVFLLCALVAASVYANDKATNSLNNGKPLVDNVAEAVDGEVIDGEASQFFSDYRMQREKTRSEEIEALEVKLASKDALSSEDESIIRQRLFDISDTIESELILESLIRAKGFDDALIFFHGDGVSVVIKAETLTENDVVKITEIIVRNTSIPARLVTVSTQQNS